MISRLLIRNFQCHERLNIHLDEHLSTIVGPSDVGKSAVLRALRWVLLNEAPRGSIARWGAEHVSVTAWVDEHRIKRTRRGNSNSYHLDGRRFTGFGKNVPKEIADIVNTATLNFQPQLSSHFWFSDTAGEVSRQLNSIVDLSIIDSTLSNLAASLRKGRVEQEVVEERLTQAKQERKQLLPLQRLDDELQHIEKLEQRCEKKGKSTAHLAALLERAEGLQEHLRLGGRVDGACVGLERLEGLAKAVESKREEGHGLYGLVSELQRLASCRDALKQQLREVKQELQEVIGEECPLCGQRIKKGEQHG